ncbi:adenosylcobinamide-GDP ribazoletransferase [Bacillus salacetis]|uniref:adenosylcobinamide-GDP ribazoletransferase n=1 Tax=Bacillus salacetis TaxID=2315464 RepID=UPI003BA329EA
MKIREYLLGLMIDLQFFSTLPVHRSINMDRLSIRRAVMMFPFFGLILGVINGLIFIILSEWTPLSPLALSFVIWILPILLTGGIHLDGWMDTSDAFFSYQDKEKRLEIMKDPRAGAFAVISVIVLLASRFLFIYESLVHTIFGMAVIIAIIPVFSRSVMGCLMVLSASAKEEGMAFYFKKHTEPRLLLSYLIPFLLMGLGLLMLLPELLVIFLSFITLTVMAGYWISRQTVKLFGGMTGDTLGASVEGVEVLLWMAVWLSAYIGMQ